MEGLSPCPQRRGKQQVYGEFDSPQNILKAGTYRPVPILFGTNSYEGTFVYNGKLDLLLLVCIRYKYVSIK